MTEFYPPHDLDTDSQEAWKAELQRRWEEMESGKVVGQPAESVFADLRTKNP
jgi:putative addiction module component (TIGR02574 family)